MNDKKTTGPQIPINITGGITVNGSMFDVHDNENVNYIFQTGEPSANDKKEVTPDEETDSAPLLQSNEELCHFIHPSIDEKQQWQIHNEVKRLVARHGIQEICSYLKQLCDENKVLLPNGVKVAYNELVRMGMPQTEGYSEKTFQKYYKK